MSEYVVSYIDPAGLEYRLNDGVHAFIPPAGLHGFGVPKITTQGEQRPYRDGALLIGRPYTAARTLSVSLALRHFSVASLVAFWRQLARNMSPYKDASSLGSLRVQTVDGLTRQIDCWMVECMEPQEINGPLYQATELTFWAPSPWFYDPALQESSYSLDSPSGVSYPVEYELTYADSDIDTYITPLNAGDVGTWPTLRVYGPGQNPAITNTTTGKLLELSGAGGLEMDAGDYLEIDMDRATIMWWDNSDEALNSVIAKLSDASEFWPLRRGQNKLKVTMANSGSGAARVRWYNYYQSGL